MSYSAQNHDDLDLLLLYNASNSQEGIKIHKTADPKLIAAAKRLFNNGFITQLDGGYLTPLGTEAAELAQSLFTMLNVPSGE